MFEPALAVTFNCTLFIGQGIEKWSHPPLVIPTDRGLDTFHIKHYDFPNGFGRMGNGLTSDCARSSLKDKATALFILRCWCHRPWRFQMNEFVPIAVYFWLSKLINKQIKWAWSLTSICWRRICSRSARLHTTHARYERTHITVESTTSKCVGRVISQFNCKSGIHHVHDISMENIFIEIPAKHCHFPTFLEPKNMPSIKKCWLFVDRGRSTAYMVSNH